MRSQYHLPLKMGKVVLNRSNVPVPFLYVMHYVMFRNENRLTRAGRRATLARIMPSPTKVRRPDPPAAPDVAVEKPPQRLAITLSDDQSRIDWDRMRPDTQRRLIELAQRDARLQPAKAADVGAAAEIFSPAWCGVIFDAVGSLEQSIVARAYHVTMEQASVMLFTEPEKRILTEPLQRVLNKYASTWLAAYSDEAALVFALGTVHINKLQQLREVVESAHRPPVVEQQAA